MTTLTRLIEDNEWVDIPPKIITREGHTVDTSGNQWHFPYSMKAHPILDFNNIINLSLRWITKRYIQEKMQKTNGADLKFLLNISNDKRLYEDDLINLGLSHTLLYTTGWIRKNGYTIADHGKKTLQNKKPNYPFHFTTKEGVIRYCQSHFLPNLIEPIHIDQNGKKYYLKDLLLVRHRGLSSGVYSHWIATACSLSMMATFLRYLDDLITKYTSSSINTNFSSHHFRHTLNTLMDEGGLSDLLQTEWFGRKNPRDTKAYQHTSREKRAFVH